MKLLGIQAAACYNARDCVLRGELFLVDEGNCLLGKRIELIPHHGMTPWLNLLDACTLLQVRPDSARTYVTQYLIRAFQEGDTLFLYSEDVLYCKDRRRKKQRPKSLFQRGLLPDDYQAVPAHRILEVAKSREDPRVLRWAHLPKRFQLDAAAAEDPAVDDPFIVAEDEENFETYAELRERVNSLETMVSTLVSLVRSDGPMRQFSDTECSAFLEEVRDLLSRPLNAQHAEKWSKVLLRVSSEHLRDIDRWAENFPARAQQLRIGDLPLYAGALQLAHRLVRVAEAAPGCNIEGSPPFFTLLRARKAQEHLEEVCVAYAAVRRAGRGERAVVPVGHCRTDQYILARLKGNSRGLRS